MIDGRLAYATALMAAGRKGIPERADHVGGDEPSARIWYLVHGPETFPTMAWWLSVEVKVNHNYREETECELSWL